VLDRRSLEQLKLHFILCKWETFVLICHYYWLIDICCTDWPHADQQNVQTNLRLQMLGFDLISSRCFSLYLSSFLRLKTEDTTGPHMHDEKQMHSFTTQYSFAIDFKDIRLDWQAMACR